MMGGFFAQRRYNFIGVVTCGSAVGLLNEGHWISSAIVLLIGTTAAEMAAAIVEKRAA